MYCCNKSYVILHLRLYELKYLFFKNIFLFYRNPIHKTLKMEGDMFHMTWNRITQETDSKKNECVRNVSHWTHNKTHFFKSISEFLKICANNRINQNCHRSRSNFHTVKANRYKLRIAASLLDRPEKIAFQLIQLAEGTHFLEHFQLESVLQRINAYC